MVSLKINDKMKLQQTEPHLSNAPVLNQMIPPALQTAVSLLPWSFKTEAWKPFKVEQDIFLFALAIRIHNHFL